MKRQIKRKNVSVSSVCVCVCVCVCTHKHMHTLAHTTYSLVTADEQKAKEAGITDAPHDSATEERDQRHRDSASTLNHGSSMGGTSATQSYELQQTESVGEVPSTLSVKVAEASGAEEGNSQQVCVSVCVCVCVCVLSLIHI